MAKIPQEGNRINILPKKLDLPLFFVSRGPIQRNHLDALRNYIGHKRSIYTNRCGEDSGAQDADHKKLKRYIGSNPQPPLACPGQRLLRTQRDLISPKPWQLPPNLYTLEEPYRRLKGEFGAYWPKKHTHKALLTAKGPKGIWKFYDATPHYEYCIRHKGVFLSNARHRRASTRSMVSSPLTCYHNPNDPGPNYYCPVNNLLETRIVPVTKQKAPNPHIFLRHSSVPALPNSIYARNISFLPGPGRYESRYGFSCPCPKRLTYMPGLQLIIDIEKRKKFRRLPYTKIKARLYCSPEWRHVTGHGHRYLFRHAPRTRLRLKAPQDAKKSDRHFQLFPDARYISMITTPARTAISRHAEPPVFRPPRIEYNCLQKRVVRRQLSSNKKIAFNSGQDRFKDIARAPILTVSQLESVIAKLPPERRLRDHPVMRMTEGAIMSKLSETPPHMMPAYELALRKKLFKFLPLPSAKVLVTESDIRAEVPCKGLFSSDEDPKVFFKNSVKYSKTAGKVLGP